MPKKDENEQMEYLDGFLQDTAKDIKEIKDTIKQQPISNSTLNFINVPIDILPAGSFYKKGTQIKIRSANVSEVQAYSVVDEKNYIDITEKMNEMLSACVRYIHANGTIGSYKNIKDGDRIFLIFMIKELTFQRGNTLAKDHVCEHCKHEFKISFRATPSDAMPRTFVNFERPKDIEKFYDSNEKCYVLNINNSQWKIAPPTIGIQEIFYNNIKTKVGDQKTPNISLLKILPYLLYDRDKITDEGIEAKEKEFKSMDMETFQILNQFVDKMKFGIEKLKTVCPNCSQEVYAPMNFQRYGAASLFVIPDFLDDFIAK
jgi:hypothetical protein